MKIIEWTPGKWRVVEQTGQDGSYTPLYKGKGLQSYARKADCTAWMQAALDKAARKAVTDANEAIADYVSDHREELGDVYLVIRKSLNSRRAEAVRRLLDLSDVRDKAIAGMMVAAREAEEATNG